MRALLDRLTVRQIAIPSLYIVLVGVILMLGHSGLQGDYGLAALNEAKLQERALTHELRALQAANDGLENKVDRLGGEVLDLDLLDERARSVLGFGRPDEIIVR